MTQLKKVTTQVLLKIVSAHSAYYGRLLSQEELTDCRKTIDILQQEIASRNQVLDYIIPYMSQASIESTTNRAGN